MGNYQTSCQCNTQPDDRFFRCFGNRFCDGGKYHKPRVTEDGDGYQEACQSQGFFFSLFAKEFQEGECHSLGSPRYFKYLPHHDTEADDDTNAAQCTAKASGDGIDDAKCFSVV